MAYEKMYLDLKESIVGDSNNWTHEEIKSRVKDSLNALWLFENGHLTPKIRCSDLNAMVNHYMAEDERPMFEGDY